LYADESDSDDDKNKKSGVKKRVKNEMNLGNL